MLFEAAVLTYNPTEPGASTASNTSSKKSSSRGRRSTKEPLKKGGWKSTVPGAQPELRENSPYEGALVLAQTNGCLRKVWRDVFQNKPVGKSL